MKLLLQLLQIQVEIAQMSKLALHKKLALDYILASEGGMCQVILKQDCCTWIDDNEDIVQGHLNKVKQLQGIQNWRNFWIHWKFFFF